MKQMNEFTETTEDEKKFVKLIIRYSLFLFFFL